MKHSDFPIAMSWSICQTCEEVRNSQLVDVDNPIDTVQDMQYLVGGIPTPLKNMIVNWDSHSQLNGKIKVMFQTYKATFNHHDLHYPISLW